VPMSELVTPRLRRPAIACKCAVVGGQMPRYGQRP
jgi:hypothetical protein